MDHFDIVRNVFGQESVEQAVITGTGFLTDRGPDPNLVSLPSGDLHINVTTPPSTTTSTKTVVFIHGAGGLGHICSPIITASDVTEEYRVITYDLEGHGQSPWGPLAEGERRVDKWARQLEEILDHVGVVETYIAAHSVGCLIASQFALAHPQRILGLFYISPVTAQNTEHLSSTGMYPPFVSALLKYGHATFAPFTPTPLGLSVTASPLATAVVATGYSSVSPKVIANVYMATWLPRPMNYGVLKIGEKGGVRVSVVEGADDWVNSDGLKADIQEDLKGAEWMTLKDTGHFALLEKPEEVGKRLKDFLATFDTKEWVDDIVVGEKGEGM